ncbi:MAG TPA: hypothetical protein VM366_15775 [Anaerolineae bacterium]|nr:hypothetical protein [Anaerolineae bacterium]
MPQHRFAILRADIARELSQVQQLVAEAKEWAPKLAEWPETIRVRTAGGILHDFYSAVERIFQHIAVQIDGDLPSSSDWHVQLLQRMATPIEAVRPAVIDHETARKLDEYLRFRHLFRHIYGFDLQWERCQPLLRHLPALAETLVQRLTEFDTFLRTLEGGI